MHCEKRRDVSRVAAAGTAAAAQPTSQTAIKSQRATLPADPWQARGQPFAMDGGVTDGAVYDNTIGGDSTVVMALASQSPQQEKSARNGAFSR